MIEHYRQQHPDERFRLLQSKPQTIAKKWQALTILPLLDIGKLSELDYKPHNMREILGYHYGSSSLTQFLGELERIGAAELKLELANCATGDYCYIDGHMIAFWSLLKMHKGKITMLGRIMPGSKAVIAHDESGSAIGLEYYPPDTHLSKIIEDYCSAIELTTGIKNFIIDREVNSVDIAKLFVLRDWNLICLLDSNEYKGAESFSKRFVGRLDDGSSLYKATWSCYHEGDPRKFVVVQETNRCLVYWTTPDIFNKLTALQIVKYYRSRAEIQENNIKRMIAHGELNTNFGNKKVYGEDRTQKRKMEKLDEKLGKLQAKEQKFEQAITTQQVKIQSSEDSGHNQRLIQRTAKLEQIQQQKNEVTQKISKVEEKKQQLGAPAVRADRDFRKQTIMTFRTLWLENVIKALFSLIFNALKQPLDIEIALDLLFFRTADRIESHDEILYYLSTKDLSNKYQEILFRLIAGFNEIGLFYKGKQVHVYASEFV